MEWQKHSDFVITMMNFYLNNLTGYDRVLQTKINVLCPLSPFSCKYWLYFTVPCRRNDRWEMN